MSAVRYHWEYDADTNLPLRVYDAYDQVFLDPTDAAVQDLLDEACTDDCCKICALLKDLTLQSGGKLSDDKELIYIDPDTGECARTTIADILPQTVEIIN